MPANTTPENRSMPTATVIPVLAYDDVRQATEWLCAAFGFEERLRIGAHRAQLVIGDGAVIVNKRRDQPDGAALPMGGHEIMVRVDDVDSHYERAQAHGARILQSPTNFPYGERQYGVEDPSGHLWTFSQTIADMAPEEWGGTLVAGDGATR
ncbi:MAG TPA: VOC family protein [Ktedonobacterales bacterium]